MTAQTYPADRSGLAAGAALGVRSDASAGPVAWGAVLAGAAGSAALSLVLLMLGTGLGLVSVSPWTQQGAGAAAIGIAAALWLAATQLAASGLGGYLAGRLRTRWTDLHTDEVYFRDTAHGFLAWAVASVVTAAVLGTATASILNSGLQAAGATGAAAATAGGAALGAAAPLATPAGNGANAGPRPGAGGDDGSAYFVDLLFRPAANAAPAADASASAAAMAPMAPAGAAPAAGPLDPNLSREAARIFINALRQPGALPAEDQQYLGRQVASRTGLPQAEAEKRVADSYARLQAKAQDAEAAAREVADKARKAAAAAALWTVVSLLVGAFAAAWAATFGGRQRDA